MAILQVYLENSKSLKFEIELMENLIVVKILLREKNPPSPGSGLGPSPVVSGVLDGLDLSADLLRCEAVEPALTNDHQDGEENRQSQHGRLELPEEMLLHHCRATAGEVGGHRTLLFS